ncbi:MAG: S8 family serine peptidase, partial [Planctomycetota bacterium]
MKHDARSRLSRTKQIETLEDRVVMSADPLGGLLGGSVFQHAVDEAPAAIGVEPHTVDEVPPLSHHDLQQPVLQQPAESMPDFWLDPDDDLSYEQQLGDIEKTLASAHDASGLTEARASYGFRGTGQTVAVIDSGIAWDHYALGNGLGSTYRVVGGWDFTENDADPYDDSGSTSHGTHVAGIVGANGNSNAEIGVAPDVDLVGLRVFDDAGAGYFSWVEQALQWVHTNRNAFENPITAVNLSLGTNWNADTTPSWAMLEDEFAQLKADGIFIAVSAGNRFTSYNTPGLSYPAASSHVVPVMAADDSGSLSYFSQRLDRAIAAPGRYIRSTVADHSGTNNNGVADDWSYKSGTSMAAPYVAGASVLIREAMEFVGQTNITQDTIYNHMIATADTFFDSATGLSYNRLNVNSALDALMPTDDYGSSMADAYNLGTINPGASPSSSPSTAAGMSGVIGELSDADYFTFTAGATGTVTFAASNTTHYLDASWQGYGGEGWSDSTGDSYTMNVVAGQQYTVSLSSSDGVGRYDFSVSAESTFTFTDWGTIAGQATSSVGSDGGETWYRVTAGQAGYVTVDAQNAVGSLAIELYDANQTLIDDGSDSRLDAYATSGDHYYIKVTGAGTADLRLTNLVSTSGATVTVAGTSGNDALSFAAGASSHTV